MNSRIEKKMAKIARMYGFRFSSKEEFIANAPWDTFCWHVGILSEEFVNEFFAYVNWEGVSSTIRHMSEKFVKKHQDQIRWSWIDNRHFSPKFIEEFADKLNAKCLIVPNGEKYFQTQMVLNIELGSRVYVNKLRRPFIVEEKSCDGFVLYLSND